MNSGCPRVINSLPQTLSALSICHYALLPQCSHAHLSSESPSDLHLEKVSSRFFTELRVQVPGDNKLNTDLIFKRANSRPFSAIGHFPSEDKEACSKKYSVSQDAGRYKDNGLKAKS